MTLNIRLAIAVGLGLLGMTACAGAGSDSSIDSPGVSSSGDVVAAESEATTLPDNVGDLVIWEPDGVPSEPPPDEVLAVYYSCLVERGLGDVNPLQASPEVDAELADCAIASGLEEYGKVYRPLTEAGIEALVVEADADLIPCFESLGFEVSTVQARFNDGVIIDWDSLYAQYPDLDQAAASCYEGHDEGNG